MATRKTRDKIIAATLNLASENDWSDITLGDIALASSVDLAQLRSAYDGRLAILEDFARQTDLQVLANIDEGMAEEDPRERLFDVLFSRFEALNEQKPALRSIASAARRDGAFALALSGITARSMAWMLGAADIATSGRSGRIRVAGVTMVWYRVMRVWLSDDDPGQARTMAALDQRLREGERMIGRMDTLRSMAGRLRQCRRSGRDKEPMEEPKSNGPEAFAHGN